MPTASSTLDLTALFDDVLAVVRSAQAATAGFRTICVRSQRKVGREIIRPLSELDLDDEIAPLETTVRLLVAKAPTDIDTLVFGLFDMIDVDLEATDAPPSKRWEGADPKRVFTGFHLTGLTGFDPTMRWLPRDATWSPDDRFLTSPALDTIAKAGVPLRGEVRKALGIALRFGAAALLARFATRRLPHRIIVAFDEGDFAEVRPPVDD